MILAIAFVAVAPVVAGEALPGPISAEVVEVIDGDTLAARARVWLGQELTVRARIAGIDAPELRGHCAADRDLAGRVIARVHTATGLDLATALLSEGFARAYQGRGPRPRWCARGA